MDGEARVTSKSPLRGRPTRAESDAIELRLREAAVAAFIASGFDGTTMEAVANAAGVTKRTLYAKYPDKQALFAAVIPRALADMPFRGVAFEVPDGDLETALRALARQIVTRLIDPQAVNLRRLAMLEAERIAELDQVDGADLWSKSLRSVVGLLAAHADAGEVVADDLQVAADLFLAMVAGSPTMWADFGVFRSPEDEARHIDHAVTLFLSGILRRR
jgi:TetR/AcrR family transcriptional repressor of mexJK operon